jgi:hypothetical protein
MATAKALVDDASLAELGEDWNSTSALVHRLQRERGATCSWVAARAAATSVSITKAAETKHVMADFRKRTNACMAALPDCPCDCDLSIKLQVVREQADANIGSARSDDSLASSKPPVEQARRFSTIFTAYTLIIQGLLDESAAKSGSRYANGLLSAPTRLECAHQTQRWGVRVTQAAPRPNDSSSVSLRPYLCAGCIPTWNA